MLQNGGVEGLYSSGGENMNRLEGHLMRVNKGSKRIMNLDLILDFGEIQCIECRDWWEQ